jgi:chemosensory pili system protein ChpC
MINSSNTLHCVIVPIEKTNIVLPNTVVAEVVGFSQPEPVNRSPEWLLGHINWQGWKVPVLDYACLIGLELGDDPTTPRIMIVKSLLHGDRLPYIGLVTTGMPKLINISAGMLIEDPDLELTTGLFSEVTIEDQQAMIPDIDHLTQLAAQETFTKKK